MKVNDINYGKFDHACRPPKKHFFRHDKIFEIRLNATGIGRNGSRLFLERRLELFGTFPF